jgi:hypothetical protein
MIEAFYALTIIAFASLSVLTMLNRHIRGGEVRDAVREEMELIEGLERRIPEIRNQLTELKYETDVMDDERVALESQTRCLLDLEERHRLNIDLFGDRPKWSGP